MFLVLLMALLVLFAFYIGILLGIKDCKRRFHIPKGVESLEEWYNSTHKESEIVIDE